MIPEELLEEMISNEQTVYRYCSDDGQTLDEFPTNPNGSVYNLAAVCNTSGNVMAMMPHPERVFRNVQNSWVPETYAADSGWMRLFRNARHWLG